MPDAGGELVISARPHHYVTERGWLRSPWGRALQVQVGRVDDAPMPWSELWEVFVDRYPGRWAVQVLPPRWALIDEVNAYHLWVLSRPPEPFRIDVDRETVAGRCRAVLRVLRTRGEPMLAAEIADSLGLQDGRSVWGALRELLDSDEVERLPPVMGPAGYRVHSWVYRTRHRPSSQT